MMEGNLCVIEILSRPSKKNDTKCATYLEAVLGCSGSDSDGYSAGKKRTGVVGAAPETGMRGALKVLKVGAPKHKSN